MPELADCGEIVRLVQPDLHPETIDFNVSDADRNSNYPLAPFDTVRVLGRYEADAPWATIAAKSCVPAITRSRTA